MSGRILWPTMLTDWAAAVVHAQSFQKYVHFKMQLRTRTQWITYVDSLCSWVLFPLSPLSLSSSQVDTQRAARRTLGGIIQGDTLLLLSSCALVLTDVSLPPSLSPPHSFLHVSPLSITLLPLLLWLLFLSIRCPNDFTGDRCQTYVMASFYRMSISSSVSLSDCPVCGACMPP